MAWSRWDESSICPCAWLCFFKGLSLSFLLSFRRKKARKTATVWFLCSSRRALLPFAFFLSFRALLFLHLQPARRSFVPAHGRTEPAAAWQTVPLLSFSHQVSVSCPPLNSCYAWFVLFLSRPACGSPRSTCPAPLCSPLLCSPLLCSASLSSALLATEKGKKMKKWQKSMGSKVGRGKKIKKKEVTEAGKKKKKTKKGEGRWQQRCSKKVLLLLQQETLRPFPPFSSLPPRPCRLLCCFTHARSLACAHPHRAVFDER